MNGICRYGNQAELMLSLPHTVDHQSWTKQTVTRGISQFASQNQLIDKELIHLFFIHCLFRVKKQATKQCESFCGWRDG